MLGQNATSQHIWRLLAKQPLSNCRKDCRYRCSFLKRCATRHQHHRHSNIIANGRIFIRCCGKGMMMHHQPMTPNNLHSSRHQMYWTLSDYNKDKTSLQQQDSYLSELQQIIAHHNAHAASMITLALPAASAWIGQCIKHRLTCRSLPDCDYESAF